MTLGVKRLYTKSKSVTESLSPKVLVIVISRCYWTDPLCIRNASNIVSWLTGTTCRFLGSTICQKSSPWWSVAVTVVQEWLTQAWETWWMVSLRGREVRWSSFSEVSPAWMFSEHCHTSLCLFCFFYFAGVGAEQDNPRAWMLSPRIRSNIAVCRGEVCLGWLLHPTVSLSTSPILFNVQLRLSIIKCNCQL